MDTNGNHQTSNRLKRLANSTGLSAIAVACATMLSLPAHSINEDHSYISISGGVLFTDENARFGSEAESEAPFGQLTFGSMITRDFAVELEYFRSDIDRRNGGEYELHGAMLDLKWFPLRGDTSLSPYISFGAGIQETEQPEDNTTSPVLAISAGMQWWINNTIGMHVEGGYRYDLYDDPSRGNTGLDEFTFLLGFDIGLPEFAQSKDSGWWTDHSSVGHGIYLGTMATFLFVDEEPELRRDAKDSLGIHVLAGIPLGQNINIELKGFYTDFDTYSDQDYSQYGAGLDVLLFPFGRDLRIAPYAQIGAAYARTEIGSNFETENEIADAGVGMLINMGEYVSLRTEARYRVDFFDIDGPGVTEYEELSVNVGLNVALSGSNSQPVKPPVPVTDDDKDGVLNINDRCPGTAAETAVDEFGCPLKPTPPKPETEASTVDTQYTIYFLRAETTLDSADESSLKTIADAAKTYDAQRILITGHTDADGDASSNVKIAKARADAVANFLKNLKVSAEIETISLGQFSPKSDNSTEKGRALNRRAEIYLEK